MHNLIVVVIGAAQTGKTKCIRWTLGERPDNNYTPSTNTTKDAVELDGIIVTLWEIPNGGLVSAIHGIDAIIVLGDQSQLPSLAEVKKHYPNIPTSFVTYENNFNVKAVEFMKLVRTLVESYKVSKGIKSDPKYEIFVVTDPETGKMKAYDTYEQVLMSVVHEVDLIDMDGNYSDTLYMLSGSGPAYRKISDIPLPGCITKTHIE